VCRASKPRGQDRPFATRITRSNPPCPALPGCPGAREGVAARGGRGSRTGNTPFEGYARGSVGISSIQSRQIGHDFLPGRLGQHDRHGSLDVPEKRKCAKSALYVVFRVLLLENLNHLGQGQTPFGQQDVDVEVVAFPRPSHGGQHWRLPPCRFWRMSVAAGAWRPRVRRRLVLLRTAYP
jgi:hypothetical protein